MNLAGVLLAAAAAFAGSAAVAHDRPSPMLYDLTGVAAGGALNVREGPRNGARIVGAVPAGARSVEVVAQDEGGDWGRINIGERSGWIAMRHFTPQADVWENGGIPRRMICRGVEPFWSLDVRRNAVRLSSPDGEDQAFAVTNVLAMGAPDEPWRELIAEVGEARLTALLSATACSDGMSERLYGLAVDVVIEAADGSSYRRGCCSIAP